MYQGVSMDFWTLLGPSSYCKWKYTALPWSRKYTIHAANDMYILYMEWNAHIHKKASINGLKKRKWGVSGGGRGRGWDG